MKQKTRNLAVILLSVVLLCYTCSVQALGPNQDQVTIQFYTSGSNSKAPEPITAEKGRQVTLPLTKLSSPSGIKNWYFTGWAENVSASAPQYLPGDSVYLTRNMDLYAVFTQTPPASGTASSQPSKQTPPAFTIQTGSHTKYMNGGSDGLFHPTQALTRAELAQLLYNIVVERPSSDASFSDVTGNDWYAPAVSAMAGLGILPGYSDGSFGPERPVTRAETAQALVMLIPGNGPVRSFPDVPSSHPAYAAISAAAGYGLFNGDGNGNFNPDAGLQRAEAAVVLNKLMGRSPDTSAVFSSSLRYFPDVPTTHWAYAQIMEATTTHGHTPSGSGEVWRDIQTEPVPLEDGFYRLNGRLYCVSGGQFLRSAAQECFYFDYEGRYTTGDGALDNQLNALVEQLTDSSMPRDDQLRALYNYCRDNFSYLKRPLVDAGATGWEPEYASAFLSMGKGNCYSFSSLFCLLAREVGQPAYTVVGGLGKSASPHGWVEIKLDGTVYTFDPQLEWRYVHDYGQKSHNLFKVLQSKAPHVYTKLSGGVPA